MNITPAMSDQLNAFLKDAVGHDERIHATAAILLMASSSVEGAVETAYLGVQKLGVTDEELRVALTAVDATVAERDRLAECEPPFRTGRVGMIQYRTGRRFRMHQFCNDWISADGEDGHSVILAPTSVELENEEEVAAFRGEPNPGTFWAEFELTDQMRFRRRRRP